MNWKPLLPFAAAATFVALLSAQVWTYASGQDSGTYMGIARGMQQWVRGEPLLTHHLKLVAPVYPALLALVREAAGPLAAYWVNPVICVLWLVLAARLGARCAGDDRHVVSVQLMTAAVAFLGYGLYPHFALYPFRSPLMLVLLFTGFLLVHRAARRQSFPALIGGWLVLLLAGLTREFALIGWITSGIWWWGEVRQPRRLRWTGLTLFLGPILLGAVSAPLWILSSGSQQIQVFVKIILRRALDEGMPFLWDKFTGICSGLFDSLGPFGLLCLLLGVWHTRRNRAVRWMILVPGLFLAFAYTPFLVHHRYLQEALAFLAILAGLGLGCLVEELRLRCPTPWQRIAPMLMYSVVLVACVLPPLLAAAPVFGRVTADDIQGMHRKWPSYVKDGDFSVVDHPEGRLWEVLQAHTKLMSLDSTQIGLPTARPGPSIHVLESVNGQGWSPKKLLRQRTCRAVLEDHRELLAWPEPFTLGGVEYRGWTAFARTGTVSRARLHVHPGVDHLALLDLGPEAVGGQVLFMDHNGALKLPPQPVDRASGWFAVNLPAACTSSGVVRIRMEATSPIPADLNALLLYPGRIVELPLGVSRRASSMRLFDEASRSPLTAPYGVLVRDQTLFAAPVFPSDTLRFNIAFRLRLTASNSRQLTVQLHAGPVQLAEAVLPPLDQGDVWLGADLPASRGAQTPMEIRVLPDGGGPAPPVWITAVRIMCLPR